MNMPGIAHSRLPDPTLGTLPGLWRRSLIAWPDGREDRTTFVNWLQGPGLYLDLRQPEGAPGFAGVACLSDLKPVHMEWLATQEGFAGELVHEDDWFEWRRDIDFQPHAVYPDMGRLWVEGDVMIEQGKDIPYIEHWHREPVAGGIVWGARLEDRETGAKGAILRYGHLFMFARERLVSTPAHCSLADCVAGARDLAHAREFLDCEIAQGVVTSAGWIIQRSTLPFRVGKALGPVLTGDLLESEDMDGKGKALTRHWEITTLSGEPLLNAVKGDIR